MVELVVLGYDCSMTTVCVSLTMEISQESVKTALKKRDPKRRQACPIDESSMPEKTCIR